MSEYATQTVEVLLTPRWPVDRLGGSLRIPEAELRATLEATRTGPTGKAAT